MGAPPNTRGEGPRSMVRASRRRATRGRTGSCTPPAIPAGSRWTPPAPAARGSARPRSRGVPRRDVPGRVHIRVAGETAGRAHEARLTLARLRIHVPACATALRSERGVNLLDAAGRLVLQSAHQEAPARPHDLPV